MSPLALLGVLGLAGFASNIAIRIVDPIVPLLAREYGVDVAQVALLATAYTLPYALGQPILGPLGDAKGKALVMSWALFVLACALFASVFATDLSLLAAARALSGLAGGACIPLSIALIGDRFPLAERGVALSRFLLAVIIGQLAGAPFAGIVADAYGWRPVFVAASAIALIAAVGVRVAIPPQLVVKRPAFTPRSILESYRVVLANPLAKYCYLAVAAEGAFIYGFLPFVAAMLEARGAGGVREAGFVVAGIGLGGLAFNLFLPSLLGRLSRPTLMRAGSVVVLAGLLGVAAGPNWPAEMAAFAVVGLGFYMLHTSIQVEATELAPEARGSAVALHAFSLFLGMAVGPLIYGVTLGLIGASASLAAGGAVIMAAAYALAARLQRPR